VRSFAIHFCRSTRHIRSTLRVKGQRLGVHPSPNLGKNEWGAYYALLSLFLVNNTIYLFFGIEGLAMWGERDSASHAFLACIYRKQHIKNLFLYQRSRHVGRAWRVRGFGREERARLLQGDAASTAD